MTLEPASESLYPVMDAIVEFERIARDYGPLLLRTARLVVMDEATAEDVAQNGLELAWRNLGALRDRRALKAWLVKIVLNQAMSAARRQARAITYLRDTARTVNATVAAAHADEVNATIEGMWDLRTAIRALPAEQRAVVALHYYQELSVPEMATLLALSPNTIKKRLGAALRKLRAALIRPSLVNAAPPDLATEERSLPWGAN